MSEEKLYNLSLKDYTLEVWKCKLGYPLNQKDIEELEHIIDYYEQENSILKEQLKEMQMNKTNYTEVNILTMLNHKYKSVLDEIREYIKEKAKEDEECVDIRYINFGEGVDYDLLKILDKVRSNES